MLAVWGRTSFGFGLAAQLHLQRGDDGAADVVLDVEHVLHFAVVGPLQRWKPLCTFTSWAVMRSLLPDLRDAAF